MNVQAFDNFRNNVRLIMDTRNISVRELASRIGTSHPYIINLLSGRNAPSIDRCEEIANELGVPLSRLISGKSKKVPA